MEPSSTDLKTKELITENWEKILYTIQNDHGISPTTINTFLKPLKVYKIEDNHLYFLMDDESKDDRNINFAITFMKKKNYDLCLRTAIQSVLDLDYDIVFLFSEEESKEQEIIHEEEKSMEYNMEISNLNPRYTFDNFIVGDNNRHAHAACVAVAEDPGKTLNPLFLYGGAGLGKTHLMHSIGHFVLQHNRNAKVLYVPSEIFTNDLIEAIKNNTTQDFHNKYRNIDLLLLDDIQFIIGKASTQEEFFNTFNVLHEAGKQIVISSDKPPKEIKNLEDRIKSRLEWGLPIDIQPPTYETRMAILRERANRDHMNIPDDVIQYIATNFDSNIRELEGALNRINLYSKLDNNAVTVEFAERTLQDMITLNKTKTITIKLIVDAVAEHLDITVEDILSTKRSADIVQARQIAMYLSRALTGKSLDDIGEYFGRDHSTVIHALNKTKESIKSDDALSKKIETIHKKLSPS